MDVNEAVTNGQRDHAQLGDQRLADYHQECLLCRRAIHRGEVIVAAARNIFSDAAMWFHPTCAKFIRLNYGVEARFVDNGWRQARHRQRCYGCRGGIRIGSLMYRVPRWTDPANPLTLVLEWVCPNCHRADTAPRLDRV